jgi:hypothetical protein
VLDLSTAVVQDGRSMLSIEKVGSEEVMMKVKHVRRFFNRMDCNGVPEITVAQTARESSFGILEILVKHVLNLQERS